ncbi:MAG: TIGR01777 family oxidoreductase [Planctomycetota bacterium]
MPRTTFRTDIPASARDVFAWHSRPGALERLVPPWEDVRVLERSGGLEDGAQTVISLRKGPLRVRWTALHSDYVEGRQFVDEQVEGPFAVWRHTHRFIPTAESECRLEDEIDYVLPFGALGQLLAGARVRSDLERAFSFRHRRTADDLARHSKYRDRPRLAVAVSGASGLVGRNLSAFLTTGGHRVHRLVRRQADSGAADIYWNPRLGDLNTDDLEGLDAIVHLSGSSIASWRWTSKIKREIEYSRVASTHLLCESLARMAKPPRTLVCASAVGFYGDRSDELVDESSAPGFGFLAELCEKWEAATEPAREAGIRVVNLRIGLVLTSAGGVLRQMLTPFRLGFGGVLGTGRQYMSWISLDDLLAVILHALYDDELAGPVNAVTPAPVTNREFTKTLGRVLRRPTLLSVRGPVLRGLFGEMGSALFLQGARVRPAKLEDAAFDFLHRDLVAALRWELGH